MVNQPNLLAFIDHTLGNLHEMVRIAKKDIFPPYINAFWIILCKSYANVKLISLQTFQDI